MSELPQGWLGFPLSEVTGKIGSGATPKGGHAAYATSGTPLIRSQNVHFSGFSDVGLAYLDDVQARKLDGVTVRENDVLLNITGASIGRVTVAPAHMDGARVNQHVAIIRTFKGVEPTFVVKFLASPSMQQFIVAENYGVTRQALTKAMIEDIALPIPPLPEQRRIVAKIDSLTEKSRRARAHLDHIPRLVEKYKQAVLAAAFRGDLTREWRVEQGVAADYRTTFLADVLTDIRYGTAKKCDYDGGATPVLRIPNVQKGEIALDDLKSANFEEAELRKLRLRPGDLLVIRSNGSLGLVGRSAIVDEAAAGMLFAGYLIRLRFDVEAVLPRYIHLWLQSASMRSIVEDLAKSTSGVNNINSTQIEQLPIKLTGLDEQNEIVRRIDAAFRWIDRLASEATSARKLLDRLDQAVLTKAFRGELVPQDPADEPASVLLERIKAERAEAPPPRRRGRRRASG